MADKGKQVDAGKGEAEIEHILKGLMTQPGVEDFLVFNESGIPIRWSTGPGLIKPGTPNSPNPIPPQIVHHAAVFHDLGSKAAAVLRLVAPETELQLMRLHTKTKEYIIASAGEAAETLLVVQRAHSAALQPLVKLAEAEQLAAIANASKSGDAKKK